MLRLASIAATVVFAGFLGCADGSQPEAGEELGPCVEGYCLGALECVRERCVDPDQAASGGEEESWESDDEGVQPPADDSDPDPDSDGAAPTDEPWCTLAADTQCICGWSEDYGAPDAPCGPAVIPGPSRCCASPGWPEADASCSCETLGCWTNGASCFCTGDQGNNEHLEKVGTCDAPSGGTCCLDHGTHICRCSDRTECDDLGTSVPSCEVELLGCLETFDSVSVCVE